MGQFYQARQSMSSISEAYSGPHRHHASLTRPGNSCLQFLRLTLGFRDHHGPVYLDPAIHVFDIRDLYWASETIMGQFIKARQSVSSISEAYTWPQRPSWASLTRPGNPCLYLLRLKLGLRGHHGPV